jgi:hypothetical protein
MFLGYLFEEDFNVHHLRSFLEPNLKSLEDALFVDIVFAYE